MFKSLITEGSIKRIVAAVVGVVVIFLQGKFGIKTDPALEASIVAGIAGIVSAYILQSGYKSAKTIEASAKVIASGQVATLPTAVEELKKGPEVPIIP